MRIRAQNTTEREAPAIPRSKLTVILSNGAATIMGNVLDASQSVLEVPRGQFGRASLRASMVVRVNIELLADTSCRGKRSKEEQVLRCSIISLSFGAGMVAPWP